MKTTHIGLYSFTTSVKSIITDEYIDDRNYVLQYRAETFEYPGIKTITLSGIYDYFGRIDRNIELYVDFNDENTVLNMTNTSYIYTHDMIQPTYTVKYKKTNNVYEHILSSYANYIAYTTEYSSDPINVGYYTITVKSSNSKGGSSSILFRIDKKDIGTGIQIGLDTDNIRCTGDEIYPQITSITYNNRALIENDDYSILTTNCGTYPGDYLLVLNGLGNFIGQKHINYSIIGFFDDVKLNNISNEYHYSGYDIKLLNDIQLMLFDYEIPRTEYNLEYFDTDYKLPGKKHLTITPVNDKYFGIIEHEYCITADIGTDCIFEGYNSLYYSKGEDIKPNIVVKLNDLSYTLIEGTDYSVEDDPDVDYSTAGTKTIIIRGINASGYVNSKTISYSVYDDSSSIAYYVSNLYPIIYQITTLSRLNVNVDNLYKFVAGSAITSIDNAMFKNCTTLELADFSKCSAEMPESMFENCEKLQYVFIIDQNIDNYEYLCFTAEEANSTIKLHAEGNAPHVYLETSLTNDLLEGWSDFIVDETIITLPNVGDKIYFRAKGYNNTFAINNLHYNKFIMTGKIAASGNLNALLKVNSSIIDLSGKDYCYYGMFEGCTSLTKAPKLPATTLASGCYYSMFEGCTSLTKAPELPATTLADYCYSCMFEGCTSLTKAPELPATTLADYCYSCMFEGCTSLTKAPELPATTLARFCYYYMFKYCTSLTQASALPSTTLADYCYYYMFDGCTSLTKAPELPATKFAHYQCYSRMLNGCTNLNNINVNLSAWLLYLYNATINWVSGVSSSGTFICPEALPQEFGSNYIPIGWDVVYKNYN